MAVEFGKGIGIASGFDLGAKAPLDSRITVSTIEERDAHVTNNRAYEGMLIYVAETKSLYQLTTDGWINLSERLDTIEDQLGLGNSTEGNSISDRISSLEEKVGNPKTDNEEISGLFEDIDLLKTDIKLEEDRATAAEESLGARVDKNTEDIANHTHEEFTIDYDSTLAFDTTEIVFDNSSTVTRSAVLGVGRLNRMILNNDGSSTTE